MENNEIKFRTERIKIFQKELEKTIDRSQSMLNKFTKEQNKDTLTLAWSALEIITDVLERIQGELVKFNSLV